MSVLEIEDGRSMEEQKRFEDSWILRREGSRGYARDGGVLYQCLLCAERGRPMFFATQADLESHTAALHKNKRGGS